ncbi:MAG: hypothetical protein DWH91_19775 [Planctomycetota bacterium]|nr:MAG: hypothetical protein DWH91_19775 [Planctomycetota bacterium]
MKKLFAIAAMIVATCVFAQAEEKCLAVGDGVAAFNVLDVTGPSAGTKLCYRCQYGRRPVVSVFAKKMTPEVAALTKEIDNTVGSNTDKKMAAFVVMLTDSPEVETSLKTVAKDQGIKHTPLTTFEGTTGPAEYKLAADAEVTVMMWVQGKVAVNKSFKAGELTKEAIAASVKDTAKILN